MGMLEATLSDKVCTEDRCIAKDQEDFVLTLCEAIT